MLFRYTPNTRDIIVRRNIRGKMPAVFATAIL